MCIIKPKNRLTKRTEGAGPIAPKVRLIGWFWLVLIVTACANNPSSPTVAPSPPPTAATPGVPSSPAATLTPDAGLTRIAVAIATQNAATITPQNARQLTVVAAEVETQNALVQNGGLLPTPTPLPTPLPTPHPVSPLPTLLASTPVFSATTLSAKLINQLSFESANAANPKTAEPLLTFALSPNGKLLALAGTHQIWLWNSTTGQIVQTVYASATGSDERGAISLSWSPDGKQLAAGGLHGVVMLWRLDETSGQLRNGPLRLETAAGSSDFGGELEVAFAPDGANLAAIDNAGDILVWDAQTYTPRAVFATSYAGHISWSPTSKSLADEFLDINYLSDSKSYGPSYEASIGGVAPYSVAWSPDGKQLAVSAQDFDLLLAQAPDPSFKGGILKLAQALPASKTANASKTRPLGWAANSQWVAVGNVPAPGKLTIFQVGTLKTLLILDVSQTTLTGLQWPSGNLLITGSRDGVVKFWQLGG